MFRNILTGAAALALITGATAQQKQTMTVNKATTNAQFAGQYHPSTGLVQPNGGQAKLGPDSIYNNNVLTGYYSVPGADQEWIDEGVLVDRNSTSTDQVNGMDFTYCSADSNPNGIATVVTMYDETVRCAGPASWPTADCAYGVAGLPGGNNGNLACWIVTLDLTGFECNLTTDASGNQLFGYAMTWDNSSTGPWLSNGGLGNDNSFVWFDTLAPNANAAFLGCYWFGGTPHAGFAAQMFGNPVETTSYSSAGGPGADDSLILTVDTSVQVGSTVNFTVQDGPFGSATSSAMWASSRAVDVDLSGAFGIDAHLLADYRSRRFLSSAAGGVHTLTVPAIAGGGKTWYTQAADSNAGPTAMSNALAHFIF
jgi:hypothetical protein